MVIVGQACRGAVLPEDHQGLPAVDVFAVDGTARNSRLTFLMQHALREVLEKMALNSQLLILQFLGLPENQFPDRATQFSVLVVHQHGFIDASFKVEATNNVEYGFTKDQR